MLKSQTLLVTPSQVHIEGGLKPYLSTVEKVEQRFLDSPNAQAREFAVQFLKELETVGTSISPWGYKYALQPMGAASNGLTE
jgi:hypothetical protein